MHPQMGMWKRFIRSILGVDRCSLSWASGRGTDAAEAGDLAEVYYKFISGGQMQQRLEIWQKFIPSLLVGDRCS